MKKLRQNQLFIHQLQLRSPPPKKVNQEKGMVPLNITIASIELDAKIIPVGLQEDGAMEVPEDVKEIGWYTKAQCQGKMGMSS
ncbi:class F sortase [Mesobacillus boroniphilus]|uniref:Uncharacterized protein n=1 Tax=Mesobacillus boroniphilus JCM 21738 TaxID=1294265 RepID=W4RNW2_9BACI|nr:class F sortase [Mesobacillus boroniphilus]GAE46115.1 hypothetical protein JCM21738_2978 [Mesobacillus boroniphilus JCM 21738]